MTLFDLGMLALMASGTAAAIAIAWFMAPK